MQQFKLKNGMRVLAAPYAGTDAATVLVLCRVGSRYEYEEINGASHFIEHMMFKGTKKRPKAIDISRALDSVGAEYNAYTGKNITGYYIKTAGEHTKLAIDLLHDMLFHSLYKNTEMARERKVIIEEIKMYEDNPIMFVEDLLEQVMFAGNTLGWEIAGSRETMKEMPRSKVVNYRDQYYVPNRMVVAVAGKLPKNLKSLLEASFGKVKDHKKEPASFTPFGDLPARKTPRVKLQKKPSEQIQVAFGFPAPQMGDKDETAAKLLAVILGGSMSSRLFVQVRERRGLAYLIRASSSGYEDTGVFMVQAGLDKSRLALATKTIIKELRSVIKNGVTSEELRRAKDYIEGKMLLSLEDSSNRAEFYARQELFLEEIKTAEEKIAEIKKVNTKVVQRVAAEMFDMSKLCVGAIGPFSSDKALLKELGI